MKEASLRVLAYIALAIFIVALSGDTPTRLSRYIGAVIGVWAVIAVIGEPIVIIRNIIHNRRIENQPTKPFDVPETNKLTKP